MAKLKAAKGRSKTKSPKARGAIPCIIVLIGIFALLMLLFFSILPSSK